MKKSLILTMLALAIPFIMLAQAPYGMELILDGDTLEGSTVHKIDCNNYKGDITVRLFSLTPDNGVSYCAKQVDIITQRSMGAGTKVASMPITASKWADGGCEFSFHIGSNATPNFIFQMSGMYAKKGDKTKPINVSERNRTIGIRCK